MTARKQQRGTPAQAGATIADPALAVALADPAVMATARFNEASKAYFRELKPTQEQAAKKRYEMAVRALVRSRAQTFAGLLAKTYTLADAVGPDGKDGHAYDLANSLFLDIQQVSANMRSGKLV